MRLKWSLDERVAGLCLFGKYNETVKLLYGDLQVDCSIFFSRSAMYIPNAFALHNSLNV